MDFQFSEIHKATRVAYSPDGTFIATIVKKRLRFHNTQTLEIVGTRTNPEDCYELEWSPNGLMVLCSMTKKNSVQVWALKDENFACTIDEGLAGLTHAEWAGDSRHIITVSEFQIRLTIWDLEERKAKYIKFPKFSKRGIAQSQNKKYLAVVERREHRDYIGVYSQEVWELIIRFKVDTVDLEDCLWSKDDRVLCVYDNPLEYRFLIYTPRGQKLAQFQAYENALGIKSISFSPKSRFLAVGSYDQVCRVFNNLTWRSLAEYEHPSTIKITPQHKKAIIYQEVFADMDHLALDFDLDDGKSVSSGSTNMSNFTMTSNLLRKTVKTARTQNKGPDRTRKYNLGSLPISVKEMKVEMDDNPKVGISRCEWSSSGELLATINDNMPMTVWIWSMSRLNLMSVVNHKDKVSSFKWAPGDEERLAICCGNDKLYLWSKDSSSVVRCRADRYVISDLRWSPDGESLLLLDRKKFCCCYIDSESTKEEDLKS